MQLTRREFLRLAAASSMGVTVLSAARPAFGKATRAGGAVQMAVLVDIARCIGCRACEAACKAYHHFPAGESNDLAPQAWTYVRFKPLAKQKVHLNLGEGGAGRRTYKVQCMNCVEPACVSACPVAALQKQPAGPVTYDQDRCIGCRYCLIACPFQVPRFEWHKRLPEVTKCNMCAERVAVGKSMVCVEACPVQALMYGTRQAMLAEAARRITEGKWSYVPEIYGTEEVGGTSFIYVSDVPFTELGFPVVVREPLPAYTWKALGKVPGLVLGFGAVLTAVEALARRRNGHAAEADPAENAGGDQS